MRNDDFIDRHPLLTFLGAGVVIILLNLLFWCAIIFGILWGLNHYGVI